nr:anionic peroxidase swpa6 [Ipomoea trifida]
MASFATKLSLALSLLALVLAGYSIYQNTYSAINGTELQLIPTWLDETLESANILRALGLGKSSSGMLSDEACVFSAVKEIVEAAITNETRMGASLIRLFFHDCFVDGCDGGILLNATNGEQSAPANANSVRGFEVIERAKQNAKSKCADTPVSCADVLAIAARDSVVKLGGQTYTVNLGRRDARSFNLTGANNQLPAPFDDLATQTRKFADKGFNQTEMVALAGAHTVGFARCAVLCSSNNLNQARNSTLQCTCPVAAGDTGLVGLDPTPSTMDTRYFRDIVDGQGLLFSDQVLLNGTTTTAAVRRYRDGTGAFLSDFAAAMVKMGNLTPSAGVQLEIRDVCSIVNPTSVAAM